MKMSYRHRTIMVLMIVAVSVFLCSCGIPNYWSPSNTTVVRKVSGVGEDEVGFNVTVEYYAGDDGANAPNIGLLLLYVYSDESYASTDSELVRNFNSTYRGSSSTGINGLSTIAAENNSPVWEFTVSDVTYGVYAFTDANGDAVKAYRYNLDISSGTNINNSYVLKLADDIERGVILYDAADETTPIAQYGFGLDSDTTEKLTNSNYVHVYAAVSAQGNGYSNLYWSSLVHVGSFNLQSLAGI